MPDTRPGSGEIIMSLNDRVTLRFSKFGQQKNEVEVRPRVKGETNKTMDWAEAKMTLNIFFEDSGLL